MVLMKGEAITAGSNPIFSAKMGREAPTSLAQATVPTRVQQTTAATAGVTAVGVVAPMMDMLGLEPVSTALAIGAGTLIFNHVTNSGFWVVSKFFNRSTILVFVNNGFIPFVEFLSVARQFAP